MRILSRQNDKPFFPANLETRWIQNGLLQYWRPGDRDHANLGGTVRSLDRFTNLNTIEGVHVADGDSPDAKATSWIAWLQCEEDPPYYRQSPQQRPGLNGDLQAAVALGRDNILERTRNHLKDHLSYCPGVLSRSGYFLLNDSHSPVLDEDGFPVERDRPGYQDLYFFAYGEDYHDRIGRLHRADGPRAAAVQDYFGLQLFALAGVFAGRSQNRRRRIRRSRHPAFHSHTRYGMAPRRVGQLGLEQRSDSRPARIHQLVSQQ